MPDRSCCGGALVGQPPDQRHCGAALTAEDPNATVAAATTASLLRPGPQVTGAESAARGEPPEPPAAVAERQRARGTPAAEAQRSAKWRRQAPGALFAAATCYDLLRTVGCRGAASAAAQAPARHEGGWKRRVDQPSGGLPAHVQRITSPNEHQVSDLRKKL